MLIYLGIVDFTVLGKTGVIPGRAVGRGALGAHHGRASGSGWPPGFWNLRAYALQFGIFISLFTLIWGFFALLFGRTLSRPRRSPGCWPGFIYLYLSYPGVQKAFIDNEMSKLTPEQKEAMESLAKANAAANTKAPGM